ncbi:hypothetical protein PVAP13_3KG235327 [Panicum virgatum]|uniref:Uncharacterized protein n=1 Tax=Panicum virgatum TaxID=38727 RepID=A0A8T0V3C1_PANVG|nr:hypothetical protein PVAP13_3KG235327 [Panicum virgatum]KAG2626640.1 hypothetical protein PVAP13_3KG235327 [Panicum virgatum]KAG2626641.1 hypothetical protein PVAP13_3KG235327 [Panicum virgatum]KAG2626642.1 hypothetical protein PVAP13_3KG235327 [Panicum virgatum]KAG2626643.1 hypothetical protein PVAP13_3KG235327 [Panicum virgatum]
MCLPLRCVSARRLPPQPLVFLPRGCVRPLPPRPRSRPSFLDRPTPLLSDGSTTRLSRQLGVAARARRPRPASSPSPERLPPALSRGPLPLPCPAPIPLVPHSPPCLARRRRRAAVSLAPPSPTRLARRRRRQSRSPGTRRTRGRHTALALPVELPAGRAPSPAPVPSVSAALDDLAAREGIPARTTRDAVRAAVLPARIQHAPCACRSAAATPGFLAATPGLVVAVSPLRAHPPPPKTAAATPGLLASDAANSPIRSRRCHTQPPRLRWRRQPDVLPPRELGQRMLLQQRSAGTLFLCSFP